MKRDTVIIIVALLLTFFIMLLTNDKEESNINNNIRFIHTSSYNEEYKLSYYLIEYSEYVDLYVDYYQLDENDSFIENYNDDFFKNKKLIVVNIPTFSGEDEYQVKNVRLDNKTIKLFIPKTVSGLTKNMAMWYFFIEIDKNINFDDVKLNGNSLWNLSLLSNN